jgi:signal transduction histidine kinase
MKMSKVIKNHHALSQVNACTNCQIVQNPELCEIEARFHAMVSNIPGLFFQFQLDIDGVMKFIYVSEGCRALLGITAEELKSNSNLLYLLINASDRASLNKRLMVSNSKLSPLDWEGRVWIDNWQDNKWINIRAIPRVLNDGAVQWEGIMINITQSKNEKHEIEQSRRELAELTTHMHQIKERERTAIAREIHDDLGGNLTAIKIGLASVIKRLVAGEAVSVKQVNDLEFIIDNTFEAVHRISSDLRPNILDLGIVAALEWQAIEFEKLVAIPCKFKSNLAEIFVTQDQAITLFRICQESMANIAKHAEASKVSMSLTLRSNEIVMKISDNGIGINSGDTYKANSFGLRGMQERVTALHGTLEIDQLKKGGTAITISLPIE